MNSIIQRFILLTTIFFLFMSLCTLPDNPFQNPDNVYLEIDVPKKKPDDLDYCVNDTVTFKVTLVFSRLVKKISILYDENGDHDEREITTNDLNARQISFSHKYRKKGQKKVKLIITFRDPGEEKDTMHLDIEIGVKPVIINEKKLVVLGDIELGEPLALSVEHEELDKVTYRWFKDLKLLQEKEKQSLIINPLKASDAGMYHCVVRTAWGQDTSKIFEINFLNSMKPPKIQINPLSQQVTAGNSARFTIKATGKQIEYQWQKNEENISGANDTLFEVKDLKIGDNAIYRCIVFNDVYTVTSENAFLKVFEKGRAPKIMKHPENKEVEEGDAVLFSIVSEGTNLKYQWFKDDEEIENAVNATLETGPVSIENNGKNYHCVVSNDEDKAVSGKATLTVKSILKPKISEHPQNNTATVGTPAMFTVYAEGKNLTYQWWKNGKKIDQATEQSYIIKETELKDNGKEFLCIVSNSAGEVVSEQAVLYVNKKPIAPKITKQPQNLRVKENEYATFSITADGTNLKYQWQRNGNDIDNNSAKSKDYTFKVSSDDDRKMFRCIISNSVGKKESDSVTLTVLYRVTYDKKDGSIPSTDHFPRGEPVPLPKLTRVGFEFKGWSDGSKVHTGDTYEMGSKNVTFTAIWEEKTDQEKTDQEKTYIVKFKNTNKNIPIVNIPDKRVTYSNNSITLPDHGYDESGWEFLGWCDSEKFDKEKK